MSWTYKDLPPDVLERTIVATLERAEVVVNRAGIDPDLRAIAYSNVLDYLLPIAVIAANTDYDEPGGHLQPIRPPDGAA